MTEHIVVSAKPQAPFNLYHLHGRLNMLICDSIQLDTASADIIWIEMRGVMNYDGFCHDFGPLNLGSVHDFCNIVEARTAKAPDAKPIVFSVGEDREKITNAAFQIGAYALLKMSMDQVYISCWAEKLQEHLLPYRDVSPGPMNFELFLKDCWDGIARARQQSLLDFGPGGFDAADYYMYDDPKYADLHAVVPGKLIALRGPKNLSKPWVDVTDETGRHTFRDFSPGHYVPIFQQLGVRAVVRLNGPTYPRAEFAAAGIALVDLYFDDCSPPPPDIVAKFLAVAEAVPGAVAVHCSAGLGRTGTLIALYLMKHHGFSAREAMGWLRVVRPGSVIGEQQRFLCRSEPLMRRAAEATPHRGAHPRPPSDGAELQAVIDA